VTKNNRRGATQVSAVCTLLHSLLVSTPVHSFSFAAPRTAKKILAKFDSEIGDGE
jgi:hypothetical protein